MNEIKNEAIKCSECGKFFNREFGMCPFCGTELLVENEESNNNQDTPLSINDTEDAFLEENTEGDFVLCPNCNNKYDINVGLCTICGYSSLELDETVAEEDEASDNVSATQDSTSDKLQNTYNSAYSDTEENKPVNYKKIGIISAIVIGIIIVIALIVNANKLSGVSMNQIETDISELSVVTNGVIESEYTPFTPYTVDSVEIEKRQTNINDKEDIVYCNIVISNEYYQTDLQIKLVYNYYDDGGWVLDEKDFIETQTFPISGVAIDNVYVDYLDYSNGFNDYASISQGSNFDRTKLQLVAHNTDLENKIDIVEYQYTYDKVIVNAQLIFNFDDNLGWTIDSKNKNSTSCCPLVQNVIVDWEKILLGTFSCDAGRYKNHLIIESFNPTTKEITGKYSVWEETTYYNPSFEKNENFSTTFNENEISFTITVSCHNGGTLTNTVSRTIEYDIFHDTWYIAVFGSWNDWDFVRQ